MMGTKEDIYLPTPIYMGNKNITLWVDELGDNDWDQLILWMIFSELWPNYKKTIKLGG